MDAYLKNVLEQPEELKKVLADLMGPRRVVVESVARAFAGAGRILLTSMGSAYNSLIPMYYALLKRGKNVTLLEASELLEMLGGGLLTRDMVVCMMSRSGESLEVNQLSRQLREVGCTSVGITMTAGSTLERNATIALRDICSFDACICLKAYSSMALCGLACVSAMEENGLDRQTRGLEAMLQWMADSQEHILDEMRKIDFFTTADSYAFLSRNYGMGAAKAASLWMEEIAFVSGDVSSIDGFYHGPVRSIFSSALAKNVIVPVYFDVSPEDRTRRIWQEITATARYSVHIGATENALGATCSFPFPAFDTAPEYHTVALSLFEQLFAYQCCKARGYEPGVSLHIAKDRWAICN